ncbi:MAG TPA: bacterioferritin [Acidimicrobiia bacterium]|nr:bacterioferritin [Acidimicrobiia bacterium]
MQTNPRVVELLNEYLTLELTALNAHFGHSRMCANWGYGRLADKFREVAFAEMKDAEAIVDRVLFFDGLPNLQRLNTVRLGESPVEALRLGLELERDLVAWLTDAVGEVLGLGDQATREFLAERLPEEEEHIDWFETQLDTVERIGEAHYLAQQIHG